MPQITYTVNEDDLDGSEIPEDVDPFVDFAFGGQAYRVMLGTANQAKFAELLEPYLAAAAEVDWDEIAPVRPAARKPRSSGHGRVHMDREQAKHVREWAKVHGYEVSERGRIPREVTEAYQAAQHGSSRSA